MLIGTGCDMGRLCVVDVIMESTLKDSTKSFFFPSLCSFLFYTCQLFLRYKREIFILGVLGFLKTTRSFPKIRKDVRRCPKSAKGEVIESQSKDAYKLELAPSAFHFKNQRSRGRYCHLFILHMVFVPYMSLS